MEAPLHELQHGKAVWLSHGFMFARLAIGLLVLLVGWKLIRADLVPDISPCGARRPADGGAYDGGPGGTMRPRPAVAAHDARISRLAPMYVVLYALVFTLVAFDGIMALQPHWFSNLLGGFYFMGSFLGAHMLLALMMIYGAEHLGVTDLVSPKQRHDLGKLCFGFTVFWTYLMWAQFLVIWYGNLPGGDRLRVRAALGSLASGGQGGVPRDVPRPVLRASSAWRPRRRAPPWASSPSVSLVGALAGAVPAGHAVGHGAARPGVRAAGAGTDAACSWACSCLLRAVRPHLPDDLAAAGRDHAGARAGPRARRGEFDHEEGRRTTCRRGVDGAAEAGRGR